MRKDLIITALLTFCLTATLFLIVPTRSQSEPEYNPWTDINGDGKIDILDVTSATGIYGAQGNPTKNVNVTNWPAELAGTTTRKQDVTIRLIEWNENGFMLEKKSGAYNTYSDLFTFNPRNDNINITRLEVVAAVSTNITSGAYSAFSYAIGTNPIDPYMWGFGYGAGYSYLIRAKPYYVNIVFKDPIDYASLRSSLTPGINIFKMINEYPNVFVWLHQLTITIEFEYLP